MNDNSNSPDQFGQQIDNTVNEYKASAEKLVQANTYQEKEDALYTMHYVHAEDRKAGVKTLQIATDKKEVINLRVKALQIIGNYLYNNPAAVKKIIGLLSATRENTKVKRAALDALLAIRFASPALLSQMPAFREGLRSIIHDRDPELAAKAIEQLAAYNDPGVLNLLHEGLKNPAVALAPEAKAIQLLGIQHTGGFSDTIRERLQKSRDTDVQIEAIHALSGDPAAQDDIQNILENKSKQKYVRLAGLSALNATAPHKFLESAKKIIGDPSDYNDVKVASLNAIAMQGRYNEISGDAEFLDQVKSLTGHDNAIVRKESSNFLAGHESYLENA